MTRQFRALKSVSLDGIPLDIWPAIPATLNIPAEPPYPVIQSIEIGLEDGWIDASDRIHDMIAEDITEEWLIDAAREIAAGEVAA